MVLQKILDAVRECDDLSGVVIQRILGLLYTDAAKIRETGAWGFAALVSKCRPSVSCYQ